MKAVTLQVLWFVLVAITAAVGAAASVEAQSFYAELLQPGWAPPPWLFGPVWTALYVMMAVSVWMVSRVPAGPARFAALAFFLGQLALNGLWSWLFFAWRLGGAAFIDIVVLWILIVATIVCFWRIRRLAAWLLVPYLLWVTFAGFLNLHLWQGNPGLLG
jgi:tryptophan-rich sensory protein